MSDKVKKIQQALMTALDDHGMNLSRSEWRELLEDVEGGVKARIECMDEEDESDER
jgi:hypothetical protein